MTDLRVAALVSHPIQYQVPLYRELSDCDGVDLTVLFCDSFGVEPSEDSGFGTEISWDIPMLEGYDYQFLTNWWPSEGVGVVKPFNPGVVRELRDGYDVVWVHGYASVTNLLAFTAAAQFDVPVVLRGESTLLDPPNWPGRSAKRAGLSRLFGSVDAFATIGTRNRAFYESFDIDSSRLFEAPYSVDNSFFRNRRADLPSAEDIREGLDIDPEEPVFLFVGKVIERKQPLRLFEAFDRAVAPGDGTLVYVGDGTQLQELKRRVRQAGRSDDVILAGFRNQSELPRFYELADVFVLPSEQENWGLVINEAMNFELPVITTDAVGAAADLVDEQNGLVIPTGDTPALAEAIETLLDRRQQWASMGAASFHRVGEWGIEETADGIVEAARFAVDQR